MTKAMTRILKDVYNNIPIEILEAAFYPQDKDQPLIKSLDDYIMEEIIEGRVLDDCNIGSGKPKEIELRRQYLIPYKYGNSSLHLNSEIGNEGVYCIPPEARENRNITEMVKLKYPSYMMPFVPYEGSGLGNKTKDLIYSHTYKNLESLPIPISLGNNMLRLDPPQLYTGNLILVCYLEYDKYFTNLNNDAIKPIANLTVCATKAYIYNKLYIKMNRAQVLGGHEIGAFREIIERYEGENDRYDELLLEARGGMTLDPDTTVDIIKMSWGG